LLKNNLSFFCIERRLERARMCTNVAEKTLEISSPKMCDCHEFQPTVNETPFKELLRFAQQHLESFCDRHGMLWVSFVASMSEISDSRIQWYKTFFGFNCSYSEISTSKSSHVTSLRLSHWLKFERSFNWSRKKTFIGLGPGILLRWYFSRKFCMLIFRASNFYWVTLGWKFSKVLSISIYLYLFELLTKYFQTNFLSWNLFCHDTYYLLGQRSLAR